MNRLLFLGLVITLAGCQRAGDPQPAAEKTAKQLDELSRKVDELKSLLADMKQGKPGAEQNYHFWLDRNLTPGQSTLSDVERLLGARHFNLDRPDRDNVLTIQYSLDDIAGKKLVLDFTRQPQRENSLLRGLIVPTDPQAATSWVLEKKWEFAFHLCGYCPHILVDKDGWQLDGKMLPGAIGVGRERTDTLVLPRAKMRHGSVNIKLANWAPEIEHLDQAELGVVLAEDGMQLDLDSHGQPYLWREHQAFHCTPPITRDGRDHWQLQVAANGRANVLVLEMRNTDTFQDLARQTYLQDDAEPEANLQIEGAEVKTIAPIGTKFFRRVVVLLQADAREVRLSCPTGLWWVRRAWLGSGASAPMTWISPVHAKLESRDGQRLRLAQNQEVELAFPIKTDLRERSNLHFALRLTGYYEFVNRLLVAKDGKYGP